MPRVIHFELRSGNPDAIGKFYRDTFGWVFSQKETKDYWLFHTGPQDTRGINGGVSEGKPTGIIPTINVDSLENSAKAIVSNGGKLKKEKSLIPGTGFIAYFEDPDGNLFAILQYDRNAK